MSLQGSLDSFALPDVLTLLASTKKTGELQVRGTRGPEIAVEGRLWFDAGRLSGSDVAGSVDAADAVFELLRLVEGTFSFGDGAPETGGAPTDVEPVLADAQERLVEWREIELVVPSTSAWLALTPEPPGTEVRMRGDQWRLVVMIGAGGSVGDAVAALGLGELSGCRAIKELVEAGLVTVGAPPEESRRAERVARRSSPKHAADPHPADAHAAGQSAVGERPAGERPAGERLRPAGLSAVPPADAVPGAEGEPVAEEVTRRRRPLTAATERAPWQAPTAEPAAEGSDDSEESDESEETEEEVPAWRSEIGDVPDLDALAARSPRSRRHPAGSDPAAEADDAEEPAEVATAEEATEGDDEPLNRGLLLKFLSSVRN